MPTGDREESLQFAEQRLKEVVEAVLTRGYDSRTCEVDDYSLLIDQYEFRKLAMLELYEVYCYPERHEFEIELLTEIIDAVVRSKATTFLVGAVAGGIVGNLAYDTLRRLVAHVSASFRSDNARSRPFREIEKNLKRIRVLFSKHEVLGIEEICFALDEPPERIEPLLKLVGFRCRRRKKRRVWMRPTDWN